MRTHLSRKDISGMIRTVLADESQDRDRALNMDIYTCFKAELGLSDLELSFIAKRLEQEFGIKLPDAAVNNMGEIHHQPAGLYHQI